MTSKRLSRLDRVQSSNNTDANIKFDKQPDTVLVGRITPKIVNKGDVFFYPQLDHPIIVIKTLRNSVLGLILTTTRTTTNVISPAKSRFFRNSYITDTVVEIKYAKLQYCSFMAHYQNDKHLTEVIQKVIDNRLEQIKLLESSYSALITKYK